MATFTTHSQLLDDGVQVADLEIRRPHCDAQGLGFIAARYCAAVIVGQHHNGHMLERRPKDALAAHIEIVAVKQRKHGITICGIGARLP